MKCARLLGVSAAVLVLFVSVSHAQVPATDVYWHLDPGVKTCSMVIDPSLTQSQWHKFTREAGDILAFKSLAPAEPLGRMHFRLLIDYASTPVDQHDPAWINTFVHPDETCPLGDRIKIPTIRGSLGVSDRVDVGAYWTTAPQANYGGVGAEVKVAFLQETANRPAASARASVSVLTGVPDFNLNVYSLDLVASKTMGDFDPYVGVRRNLVVGTETTSKVDLDRESHSLTQGYVGVAYSVWRFRVATEYDLSTVNTFVLAVGAGR